MQYYKSINLKDGKSCVLRNATEKEAEAVLQVFILTHTQTDYLMTYPEETTMTVEEEARYLQKKTESSDEIEILAEVDGRIIGIAGIDRVGTKEKIKHRAEYGISIDKDYWGLGIGRALTQACIACAKEAGYVQMELDVVAENKKAIALYESEGFVEYGRNPKGFRSRLSGWQELVLMRRELCDM